MEAWAYIGDLIKESRKKAGYTQEKATELLPIELRTLQYYEANERYVSLDLVPIIAAAYNDTSLNNRVLRMIPLWGALHLPTYNASLSEAAAGAMEAMDMLTRDYYRDILHIVRDGQINADETEKWNEITIAIRECIAWLFCLLAEPKKGEI